MKIKVSVSTNRVGSKVTDVIEIDDEELEGMNEDARNSTIDDIAQQWLFDNIDWNWEIEP